MSRIKLVVFMLLCCGFVLNFLPSGVSNYQVTDAITAKTFDVCGPDDFEVMVELQSIGVIELKSF